MFRPVLSAALLALGLTAGTLTSYDVVASGRPSAAPALAPAAAPTSARSSDNPVTPGDFTGYGFDQCLTPEQWKMDRWLEHSPFFAVGIYISGDSRACREQPNLDARWVRVQLRKGWRLLPITLGPQASCQPRFPRYGNDVTISAKPGKRGKYSQAKQMGIAEASSAVAAATALGIVRGSTLWYDLEGYDNSNEHCRESALTFLSGWTERLHELDYVSGVYSSAGSGIAALDSARVNRPGRFTLPDAIWLARWDGRANTSTSYIREDGWRPGGRVKQYRGGHDETWGGVRINIDSNWLDLGRGSVAPAESHCDGTKLAFWEYDTLHPATPDPDDEESPELKVKALQCLLTEQGLYAGQLSGVFNQRTLEAARAFQTSRGFEAKDSWSKRHWMSLLVAGPRGVLKIGSAGPEVRRLQRALNAADATARLRASGVYRAATQDAVRAWQKRAGLDVTGIVASESWSALAQGAGVR